MATKEKQIWDFFIAQGLTPVYAAAFMGNLWYESGQNLEYGSTCKQGAGNGNSAASINYTTRINTKDISEYTFTYDDIGYGLAQWTFWSRKQALYNFTVKQNISIGDLTYQLRYLVTEQEFKNTIAALNALPANERQDVKICTYKVCDVFENPDAQAFKDSIALRQAEAENIYIKYVGSSPPTNSTPTMTVGQAILAVAQGEVGTYETGPNVIKYTSYFNKEGSAWCAYFLKWCADQARVDIPGWDPGISKSNAPDSWNGNAIANETWISVSELQSGDIVFFNWGHVGIVESRSGDTFTTIEGNTGSPEGVHRCTRYASSMSGGQRLDGTTSKPVNQSGSASNSTAASAVNYHIEYQEVSAEVKTSTIYTADVDANAQRTRANSLLTTPTLVESPFIWLTIGNYTFGSYSINGSYERNNSRVTINYPNYMNSIKITKVNGQVNQYQITMIYQIRNGDDPNLLDKIFSSVGYGKVHISYGDWNAPKFIYQDEEAIITKLSTNVDFANSRITYTLNCTSNALVLMSNYNPEPATNLKPSQRIHDMIYKEESKYGLQKVFTAFAKNEAFFWKCVASDDVSVEVNAKPLIDPLSYINYLVTCMSPTTTPKNSALRDANYYLTIREDKELGTYFTIKKVSSSEGVISLNNSDVYEVDVGYPGDALVTSFKIDNQNSWSLLYNYAENINMGEYSYNIDSEGNIYSSNSPSLMMSSQYLKTTETQRSWWTQMTQFPVTATLTIKGLLRPAMLMSYVRVNALFYGLRHVSSGLYIITKQVDTIDANGYRTTLSLTRVAGDLDAIITDTKTVTTLVPVYVMDGVTSTSSSTETNQTKSKKTKTPEKAISVDQQGLSPAGNVMGDEWDALYYGGLP